MKPWFAWFLAFALIAVLVPVRIGALLDDLSYREEQSAGLTAVGIAAVAGLFGIYILVMLRRGPVRVLLSVQALLAFGPYAVIGHGWGGIAGLLGAVLLLTLRPRVAWLLLIIVVGTDATVRSAFGVLPASTGYEWGTVLLVDVNVAIVLFAIARLAQLVQATHDVRQRLVAVEVEAERERAADRLRRALGDQLAVVVQRTRTVLVAPEPSRAELAELRELVNTTVSGARPVTNMHRAPRPAGAADTSAPARSAEAAQEAPFRFCWWVAFAMVVTSSVISIMNLGSEQTPTLGASAWAVSIAVVLAAGAFQLYHGTPRAGGSAPRWWRWTLPAHLLMLAAAILVVSGPGLVPILALAGGAALTRLRPAMAWPLLAILCGFVTATAVAQAGLSGLGFMLYWALSPVGCALAVYALCRLPEISGWLHGTRDELARSAVLAERLRFARDVHDVFGLHLTVITMKAELAWRTVGDAAAVRGHLMDLARSAELALVEVRAVAGIAEELRSASELAIAKRVLEAAGVDVTVEVTGPPPADRLDRLLAIVIRESVTNVVRHSQAGRCTISLDTANGVVRLLVGNDGVGTDSESGVDGHGNGLVNLATRAEVVGGRVAVSSQDDSFLLTVEVPV
nr:histidine kinase [Phytoactinopolyspora alkaliphila]